MFKMSNIQNDSVEYANNNYNLDSFIILNKSSHTYVGEHADAELIIVHKNNMGSGKLYVCVPLMQGATSDDNSIVLDNVLSEVGKRANSNGMQTKINLASFNLNRFIPKKPYIIYNGNADCRGSENNEDTFIVFRKQDAIKITPSSMNLLNNVIKRNDSSVKEKPPKKGFFFNKKGPTSGTSLNGDIYIDCKPTGNDGEILVPTASAWAISANTMNMPIVNIGLSILVGCLIMYLLIKLSITVFSSMNNLSSSSKGSLAPKTVSSKTT
jgi:hypothetical protein